METRSSILVGESLGQRSLGELWFLGLHRVGHD